MKIRLLTLAFLATMTIMLPSCEKEEDPGYADVTLGAQANTSVDGFYAVEEDATYTMAEGADNQPLIDIFCFYEAETGNNIALASPGTGITGIFTGEDAPENWATKNTTFFLLTTLTEEQFMAVQNGDELIVSSFDPATARRKAKDLQVGNVWSVMTTDGIYGLLFVEEVTQGTNGKARFLLKTTKVLDGK